MRKIHTLGLMLFALLALGASTASSAFAASAFLLNGAEIKANVPATVTTNANNLLLEDMGVSPTPDILCSGSFDGTITGASLGVLLTIEAVLMLPETGETEGLLLEETVLTKVGDDVECEDMNNVCSAPVLLVALNLPWHTEVELSGTTFLLHFLSGAEEAGKEPEYYLNCNTLIGLIEDFCHGLTNAQLVNGTGGLEGLFSENETTTPSGTCTAGGEKEGLLFGGGLITSTSGTLTVS